MGKIIKGRLLSLKQTGGSNVGAKHCMLEIEGDKPRKVLVPDNLLSFFQMPRIIEVELIGVGLGPIRSGVAKVAFQEGEKLTGLTASPISYLTHSLSAMFFLACAFLMYEGGDPDLRMPAMLSLIIAAWQIFPIISYAAVSKTGYKKV